MLSRKQQIEIVLCADDYALSPGVSDGILELVKVGRLSAVGCMTTSSFFPEYGKKLTSLNDQIDIGLHFTLTDLPPISSASSLAPENKFPAIASLTRRALFGKLPREEIRRELACQINKFADVIGRPPDFIDGHQHVHQLPGVRDIIVEFVASRPELSSVWLRDCSERITYILRRGVSSGRALAIGWFGAGLRRRAQKCGIPMNRGFSGIYDFSNKVSYGTLFDRFTNSINSGTLIVCHPGRVDEELRRVDPLTDQREVELEYILSKEFSVLLDRKNIRLGRLDKGAYSRP